MKDRMKGPGPVRGLVCCPSLWELHLDFLRVFHSNTGLLMKKPLWTTQDVSRSDHTGCFGVVCCQVLWAGPVLS